MKVIIEHCGEALVHETLILLQNARIYRLSQDVNSQQGVSKQWLEYGIERWNAKWNGTTSGMENETECRMYTNLCDWCCTIKVELATMYAIILSCLVT